MTRQVQEQDPTQDDKSQEPGPGQDSGMWKVLVISLGCIKVIQLFRSLAWAWPWSWTDRGRCQRVHRWGVSCFSTWTYTDQAVQDQVQGAYTTNPWTYTILYSIYYKIWTILTKIDKLGFPNVEKIMSSLHVLSAFFLKLTYSRCRVS